MIRMTLVCSGLVLICHLTMYHCKKWWFHWLSGILSPWPSFQGGFKMKQLASIKWISSPSPAHRPPIYCLFTLYHCKNGDFTENELNSAVWGVFCCAGPLTHLLTYYIVYIDDTYDLGMLRSGFDLPSHHVPLAKNVDFTENELSVRLLRLIWIWI